MTYEKPYRIDVHHHIVTREYLAALDRVGIRKTIGFNFPEWSPQISLDFMEQNRIRKAILSVSTPGVFFGDAAYAADLARQCNENAARVKSDYPDRFGFFAVMPMPVADAAVKEAVYALDTLKADGVGLLASSGGRFLGDREFDELMSELNRRKAVVSVHPNIHPSSRELKLETPVPIVEFVFDTTRAAVNLVLTGTLERYPDIRWILAHAGGTVPYVAMRIEHYPGVRKNAPLGPIAYLRRFYYDTALSCSPYTMACLQEFVEPSRILLGSDFPFAPASLVTEEIREAYSDYHIFNETTRQMVEETNASALFEQKRDAENVFRF